MSEAREKQARIVEARLKLRQRWFDKMQASPSVADDEPMGSGPKNKHGMPQVPPGQHVTKTWPVLDLGVKPKLTTADWKLIVDGAVATPLTLDWASFQALPQTEDVSDFHCVTTWSLLGSTWRGVQLSTVAALAGVDAATHLMTYGADGYTTNLPLEEALKDDVLLVHSWNGIALPPEHGGPVRLITPQLYAWKGAKWITRLEFLKKDKRGFWEERGYSNTAHPWRDDRYS